MTSVFSCCLAIFCRELIVLFFTFRFNAAESKKAPDSGINPIFAERIQHYLMQEPHASQDHVVRPEETAVRIGSGRLEVFSTPMLLALMENTALSAIEKILTPEEDSVGAGVRLEHLKPSAVGETLRCTACLEGREGKMVTFRIEVFNQKEELVARASHTRAIIDPVRFMSRLSGQKS